MSEFELRRIQKLVKQGCYIITDHAIDEMNEDDLLFADIINIILTGFIRGKETDDKTKEQKYIICGKTLNDYQAEVVCKISKVAEIVIITVYVL
jgi:DNA replication initiation complex subunit (GINS family)